MRKKLICAILTLSLASSLNACLCSQTIQDLFDGLDESINGDILSEIPGAISKVTLKSYFRKSAKTLQYENLNSLIIHEAETSVQLQEIILNLKKENQILKQQLTK